MFFQTHIQKTRLSVLAENTRAMMLRIGIIGTLVLGFLYFYLANYAVFRGYVRNQVIENRQKIVQETLYLDYKISELQKTEFLKKNHITKAMSDIEVKRFLRQS